jgi:N-acetylneuraminic acid mutarotase
METEESTTLDIRLPLKRRAFSGVVKNEKIYLVGGISEGGSHFALLDNVTELNSKNMEFTELAPLPYGTFAPAVGVINDSLFVFGGMLKMGKWEYDYVGHIYQYKVNKDSWSHTGRYMSENKGFSQIIHFDSKIGVLGGHTYRNEIDEPVASFEVFEWKAKP